MKASIQKFSAGFWKVKENRVMSKRAEELADFFVGHPFEAEENPDITLARLGYINGYEKAEEDFTPLINRLCEAILFEWKDAADLARKTLTQIKAQEEEK